MQQWREFFNGVVYKNGVAVSVYLFGAIFLWIVVLIIMPQIFMFDFSFRFNLPPTEIGGEKDVYTFSNYRYFAFTADGSFNGIDTSVFGRTLLAAFFVTLVDLAICYPIAYYLAHVARGGFARIMVLSLVVPYWINEILRAFAFRIIFSSSGVVNSLLLSAGLIDTPIDFIREDIALYLGLSYAYILLMIFPIYNAVESLDYNQIEAARDMGASWIKVHRRIVIPFAKPGIASGCTVVFMLTAGALAMPQIVGGPSNLWFTQIIYQWFNTGGNWNRGSAYAIILLICCIALVLLGMRVFKVRLGEVTK